MPSKLLLEGQQYKAKLDERLKDGKVTKAEVAAIKKEIRENGTTEVKAYYLASWAERNGDKFESGALQSLQTWMKGTMAKYTSVEGEVGAPQASGQPALADDDKSGVSYGKLSGSLFVGGAGADDALQGALGDCYFISSMAAVAERRPDLIQNAIKDNHNGTYTVTFYAHPDMSGPAQKVQVTVDGQLPQKYGQARYVGSRSGEQWPMILEKAFAQWKGGYEAIQGGMAANALSALTGAKPGFLTLTDASSPTTVWNKLKSLTQGGACVVAASQAFGQVVPGIVDGHAYTVLGTVEQNGQKFVQLRNPWGQTEPGRDGKDDGVFLLPLADFIKAYEMVEYVQP